MGDVGAPAEVLCSRIAVEPDFGGEPELSRVVAGRNFHQPCDGQQGIGLGMQAALQTLGQRRRLLLEPLRQHPPLAVLNLHKRHRHHAQGGQHGQGHRFPAAAPRMGGLAQRHQHQRCEQHRPQGITLPPRPPVEPGFAGGNDPTQHQQGHRQAGIEGVRERQQHQQKQQDAPRHVELAGIPHPAPGGPHRQPGLQHRTTRGSQPNPLKAPRPRLVAGQPLHTQRPQPHAGQRPESAHQHRPQRQPCRDEHQRHIVGRNADLHGQPAGGHIHQGDQNNQTGHSEQMRRHVSAPSGSGATARWL